MFDFNLTDELKLIIKKLVKKDKKKVEIINKKIKEIINSDKQSIEHYKNLRYDLKEYKRVHIDKSFVLAFKVDIVNNFILFADFDHHDKIYKKKFSY
jgi:YafQ family addiction module toxin component